MPHRQPDQTRATGDEQTPFLALICLVLAHGRDSISISVEEQQRLYALYPKGFGLLVARDDEGAIHVKVTGEAAFGLLREYQEQLQRGVRPPSLNDLMGAKIVRPERAP